MKNISRTTRKSDPLTLGKYKEYFKSFIKFKRNYNNHKSHLNAMYLQFRERYQNFVINQKNTFGLKFKGNKIYENLPINIFQDNYIINTFNISKELENKVLGYFLPFESPRKNKIIDGEKIKLTPIPYKKDILINSEEERNKIKEAKRSAVLMRQVEYTHLIKKNKPNNSINYNKDKNSNYLADKIYILKGAIIIIEDWWREMKNRRKYRESKKNKGKMNLRYNSNMKRDVNNIDTNLNSNKIRQKKELLENKSYKRFKSNNKKVNKKPIKLNIENSYTFNSNDFGKSNSNKINLKLSNNINKSTALNSKALSSTKNFEGNQNIQNKEIMIKNSKNKIISKKEKKNVINEGKKLKRKKPFRNKSNNLKFKDNNTNNNNINYNKNIFDINNSINIESLNKIKAKIYNALNKKSHINNNRNKKNLNNNYTLNNKSTNYRTNNKNNNRTINNLKVQNHLKKKKPTELVYDFNDLIKINNSINNINTKNKNKKAKKKPKLELHLKTNYDLDRKNTAINNGIMKFPKSTDNKRINNLDNIFLNNRYNTEHNIELNLLSNKKEKSHENGIKYVESKENGFILIGSSNKNITEDNKTIDNNDDNENNIKKVEINLNNKEDNFNINNNLKDLKKDRENITENILNFNLNSKNEEKEKEKVINNFIDNIKNLEEKDNLKNKNVNVEYNDKNKEDLMQLIIKRNRTYSFKDKKPDLNIILQNNKSKDDSNILNETSNKVQKLFNIDKNEEFFINNDMAKEKKFNNLEIIEKNENIFILNSKIKPEKLNNVQKSFEFKIISNNKDKLNEAKELKIENIFFQINNKYNLCKENNILSINNIEIEPKNDDTKENNKNIIYIINNENEDSDIIPIEQDKNNILFSGKNKFINYQISPISNFCIENNILQNKENQFILKKNLNSIEGNNNTDEESDGEFINTSSDKFNVNLPKSGKYDLLEKITELFPQNNKEINNNIKINNLKVNKSNYYFINYNDKNKVIRPKSENKINQNKEGKRNYIQTNLTLGVPDNVIEIYKIYKSKSGTKIKSYSKKNKNFEYLRTLEDKFEYE